jgi:hypothetical protein
MVVSRANPFVYRCLNLVPRRGWLRVIKSYLTLLTLVVSFVLTGCTGRVTVSNAPSLNTVEATIATPSNPINAQVTTTLITGTCKIASFELMALSSGGGSSIKAADVMCSPNGTYSITTDLSALPDGNITLTLLDPTTGRLLGTTSVAKDTVPPVTAALSPPPSLNGFTTIVTNVDPTDTIHYSFKIGAQSAVDCALDAGYSISIPVGTAITENIALIPDGPIRLCLRGQDSAGNWQTTATVLDWVKDTTVSTATLSGFPSSVTNIAAASGTVAGTGVTHYRMKFGLAASTDCALSSGYGAETAVATGVSVTATSGDGLYKLCVIGKNAIGNWQDVTNATSVSWPYDSAAPTLTITSPAASTFISPNNQANLTLTISCSENTRTVSAAATSSVDSSQATGSGTCSGGTVSVALNVSALPEGGVTLTASQTDAAGNSGASAGVTLSKDTQAPTLTGSVTDGAYLNSLSASPTLSWSAASDTNSGIAKYQVAIGTSSGGTQVLAWTDVGNVTSYQATGLTLSDATTYYPQVRAIDAAGNISSAMIGDGWTTDMSVPTALLSGLPMGQTSTAAATGTVGGTSVTSYRMKFGVAASTDCTGATGYGSENSIATSISVTASSGDGLYKVCAVGKNAAGTWQPFTSATSYTWTYDTTAPTVTVTAPSAGAYVSSSTQSALSVTVTCSENTRTVTVYAVSAVNSGIQGLSTGTCSGGSVTVTIDVSALPQGEIKLSAEQTDAAGNTGESSEVSVTKDSQAPTLAGSVTDGTYFTSLTTSPSFSWTAASDTNSGIAKYQVAIGTSSGGTQVLAWTDVGNVTSYQATGLTLSDATTYYPQVRAIDAAGNISSAVIGDGWIVDATAPSFPTITFTMASDDWSTTQSPVLTWSAANDSGSGLLRYEIAIGTAAGLSDVKAWTAVGNVTTTTITGLTLTRGVTYFPSVRAIDVAGNASPSIANGDGWLVNHELWITNGQVNAIVRSGNTVYLGGSFTKVSPWTGSGVPVSPVDGSLSWPNPASPTRIVGLIYTSISDGNGGFYVAGNFGPVNGLFRGSLVHIKANGSLDTVFVPNAGLTIYCLLLSGSTLYVGGGFSMIGGGTRANLAAISAIDGSLISTFSADTNGTVRALAISGSKLFVGGDFTTIAGANQAGLAAVSTSTGALDSTFQAPVDNSVYTLALSGSTLFVGGDFSTIKSVSISRLAAVSVADGAVATSFNASPQAGVRSIAVSGSTLYVGGLFASIGGLTRSGLAAVSASTGAADPAFNPSPSAPWVTSLVVSGSTVYFTGTFSAVNGTNRNNAAAVSTVDGSLVSSFNPDPNGSLNSISLSGSRLFLGGIMDSFGGVNRSDLAAVSAVDGSVITSFNPGSIDYSVSALALSGSTLYLGGSFTTVGGTARSSIAAVSATDGSLVTGFNPGANAAVLTLALSGSTLYMGGSFTSVASTTRNYIAAVSTSDGSLITGFNPNASAAVRALVVSGSTVYLGGSFTTVGGTARNRIAAVLTTNGSLVTSFNPNAGNTVNALALSGSTLYLGGTFTTVGGQTHNRVAAVSTADGSANASFTASASGSVTALLVSGSTLYLGGAFTTVNSVTQKYLAAVSTTNGASIAGFAPTVNGAVSSLVLTSSTLYAGTANSEWFYENPYLTHVRPDTGAWLPGY